MAASRCWVYSGENAVVHGEGGEVQLTSTQCSAFPPGEVIGAGGFATAYEHALDPNARSMHEGRSSDGRCD